MSTAYMSRILQMLCQPMQGNYSLGTALIRASADGTVMPDQSVLEPIVNGCETEEAIVKVERNPATTDGSWVVSAAGTAIPITSIQGGAHVNLAAGTSLRFDDPPNGIIEMASVGTSMVGGTRNEGFGALHQVRAYKDLGTQADAKALFAAQLGDFPAAVLCWRSTTPGDGSLTPSIGFDPTRLGRGRKVYTHKWDLFVVTSRLDSSNRRKREGDVIRDRLLPIMTDRRRWRDVAISYPVDGLVINDARAVAANQTAYVDVISFTTYFVLERFDPRSFSPWLHTHLQVSHPKDPAGHPMVDDLEPMPTG